MLEIKTEKRTWVIKEVKVKNDLGEEQWYKASNFIFFAETAKFLEEPVTAGAGQKAGRRATPDGAQMMRKNLEAGKQIYIGIDIANSTDQTAGFRNGAMLPLGKTIEKELADRIGLHYGA